MTDATEYRLPAEYRMPEGELSLSGPVARPATGTVAIRGDLAHIELAEQYLCAHYVIPMIRSIGTAGATLLCQPRADSDPVIALVAGTRFEALDYAGPWCWGCIGPQGPSGYLPLTDLQPEA